MKLDLNQRRLFKEQGVFVQLRLVDGSVKAVIVRSDGWITKEWYEEWGIRAEKYDLPRFRAEEIESWGYYQQVYQPSWRCPFKKVKVWMVRVWADGRMGNSAS